MDNCDNGKMFLKKEIMSLNFAINDLALFLDTHPNSKKALELHNEYVEKITDLTKKYQELFIFHFNLEIQKY